jgi:hypothetical protein
MVFPRLRYIRNLLAGRNEYRQELMPLEKFIEMAKNSDPEIICSSGSFTYGTDFNAKPLRTMASAIKREFSIETPRNPDIATDVRHHVYANEFEEFHYFDITQGYGEPFVTDVIKSASITCLLIGKEKGKL